MTDLFGETCPCCGQQMPEQTETSFDEFWSDVTHKIGKEPSRKAWSKLSKIERKLAHDNVKSFYAWFTKTYPGASPIHPSSYLNQKRWEDEGVKRVEKSESDVLDYWAKEIKGSSIMFAKPSSEIISELLKRGMVTLDEVRMRCV